MDYISQEEREKMERADFGDPDHLLYPVRHQADLDAAASLWSKSGKPEAVKANLAEIAARKGLRLPASWQPIMSAYSGFKRLSDDGQFVVREGIIWRSGDYSDTHGYAQNPEDALIAAQQFRGPVPLELEHFTSDGENHVLENHLGYLDRVWCSDDGWTMFGTARIPLWLDEILVKDGRDAKVSAVWEVDTHNFVRLGLVIDPAVRDAALFEARQAAFAGHPKETKMVWLDSFKAWFKGQPAEVQAEFASEMMGAPAPAVASAEPDAEIVALRQFKADAEDKAARAVQEQIEKSATEWIAKEKAAGRIAPAEEAGFRAQYVVLASAPVASRTAKFTGADGVEQSVDAFESFKESVEARTPLTGEVVNGGNIEQVALFAQVAATDKDAPLTPARRAELLAMTPAGQAALAAEKK